MKAPRLRRQHPAAARYNRKLAQGGRRTGTRPAAPRSRTSNWATSTCPCTTPTSRRSGTPADVMRLKQIFYEHPAWIICTPEYNASYPALLKNTLDWLSSPVKGDPVWSDDFRFSRGKVVGMLSASPGALGGLRSQSHLAPLLLNLHCWVAPRTTPSAAPARPSTRKATWLPRPRASASEGDRPGAVGRGTAAPALNRRGMTTGTTLLSVPAQLMGYPQAQPFGRTCPFCRDSAEAAFPTPFEHRQVPVTHGKDEVVHTGARPLLLLLI